MRVCIVAREKPYIDYFAPSASPTDAGGAASRLWPEAELLQFPRFPDASSRFDVCAMPCEDFLSPGIEIPADAVIAYGMVELALPCLLRGASDFMREGWILPELWARLWRFLKPEVGIGGRTLNVAGGAVELREEGALRGRAELAGGQERILRLLLKASPRAVPASLLARAEGFGDNCGALTMAVSRLRARLDALSPGLGSRIKSERGRGYAFLP